jgi:hypothetical protein
MAPRSAQSFEVLTARLNHEVEKISDAQHLTRSEHAPAVANDLVIEDSVRASRLEGQEELSKPQGIWPRLQSEE